MYNIIVKDRRLEIFVDKSELDLDKTFNCGQAFRWNKKPSGEWVGVVNNKIFVLKQIGGVIYTNLEEEYKDELVRYLNLDMSYTDVISKINLTDFERKAYEKAQGIHILRQDLFETMVTFLMSSCNTMRNIKRIIELLCDVYGDDLTTDYYDRIFTEKSFPTLYKLSQQNVNDFRAFSMGFRANYLYDMCQYLIENISFLNDIEQCDYKNCIKKLTKFNGIGDKVANCIVLFSLHHIDAFPIDTHINKIIQREYNGYIDLNKYNNVAGIIQQYLFYYEAFK